jgi:hypothetical protein
VTATADLVRRPSAAFNSRDVERLLTLVTDDVDWPDGPARRHGKDDEDPGAKSEGECPCRALGAHRPC